jgi:hypothetical protein
LQDLLAHASKGFAISIETPPVDCQFGNAANMFSNFLTIIASLDFC